MLKAILTDKDGGKIVLLGLSIKNVTLLCEGKPLFADMKDLCLTKETDTQLRNAKIVIIVGTTEEDMLKEISNAVGPKTEIIRDPSTSG